MIEISSCKRGFDEWAKNTSWQKTAEKLDLIVSPFSMFSVFLH